jgi:hypothetical protein
MVLTLVGANVAVHALCRLADPSFKMNHFAVSAYTTHKRPVLDLVSQLLVWCHSLT